MKLTENLKFKFVDIGVERIQYISVKCVNPNWHEGWYYFHLIFGSDFISWFFIKTFQTFWEVKIDINQVTLTSCPVYWVFWKLPLGAAKDGHFSFIQRSCQLGLKKSQVQKSSFFAMSGRKNPIKKYYGFLIASTFKCRLIFTYQHISFKLDSSLGRIQMGLLYRNYKNLNIKSPLKLHKYHNNESLKVQARKSWICKFHSLSYICAYDKL